MLASYCEQLERLLGFKTPVFVFTDDETVIVCTHRQNRRRVNPRYVDYVTPMIFKTRVIYVSHKRLKEMKHGRLVAAKARIAARDGEVFTNANGSSGREERASFVGKAPESTEVNL